MAYKGARLTGTSRVFPAPDPKAPPVIPNKIFSSSTIVEKMMLNCSGCSTLQDIVNLDLSNRRISTLDPAVFSRMSSLVELNLTNNRLTGFPLSLGLRHLKKLNVNNNQLSSVQTLEQFPNLEELHIENNELTVADQYISVYMLPRLKALNGKEVDLRETIMNMEETLQEQVHILWAESCGPLLKDPMSKAEIQMLEQQFIELLKNQVQFGPDALKDFTHHMLTVLAEKCVRQMTAHLRKIQEPSTPISKVQIVVRNETGSGKTMSNGVANQAAKVSDKRQIQASNSGGQEPASKKSKSTQGTKTKVPKTTAKRKMIEAQKKGAEGEEEADNMEYTSADLVIKEEVVEEMEMETEESTDSNQECGIAYEPVHLLRCHSVNNDPTDAKTNVWKCAFEPNPEVAGSSKWTVATCGSNQVCVIDCNSGKVLKKYQHTKDKEEFYCIAWTKLGIITETLRRPTTVLAAAGVRGSIKLLHTTQLLCYAEIKLAGRARPINCLLFHPKRPTWLFCGAEDISVIDIGIPHGPDLKIRHKKLFGLEAPGRCLGLVICPLTNFLMAGCDNGCYGWSLDPPKGGAKRDKEHSMEFLLPSKARKMGDDELMIDDGGEKEGDMIDGLALLKDDLIASKVACDGSIHVWSLSQSKKNQRAGSKEVTINPLYTLEWCDSDSVYLDIGTWPGCGVLVSGDDQGEVWVYDVSKRNKTRSKKPVKPSQLLPWPENNEQELSEIKEEDVPKDEKEDASAEPSQMKAEEQESKDKVEVQQVISETQPQEVKEVAETAETAVANVLDEVVAKVVGSEEQVVVVAAEEVAVAAGEGQVTAEKLADDSQAAAEKVEEKPEDGEKEVVAGEESKPDQGADGEQAVKASEAEGKEVVAEITEVETASKDVAAEAKEGEVEAKEVEAAEQTENQEREGEKVEGETEKERQGEKETDAAEEQPGEKEAEKTEEAEESLGRGRRKKTPIRFEEPSAPVVKEKSRGRGRPRKSLSEEEEKIRKEKERTKSELIAAGIVRGRGRPRKNPEIVKVKEEPKDADEASPSSTAKARRDQKVQEAAKVKAEKAELAAKLRAEKAEKIKQEKAEKKAQSQAAAAAAKEARALEKAQKAKERAELQELRQSLKKPKKGSEDLMDIANSEDRIIVNDVAISSDCKFIVSVTNKNLICIWQKV